MKRRPLVLIVLSVMLVTAAILWGLSRLAPSWWSPPPAGDAEAARLAERVEYGVVQQAHLIRANDKPWSVRVTQTQVNAWLALRLRPWIEREFDGGWPEQVAVVQAHLHREGLTVAAKLNDDGAARLVSVELHPRIAQGQLHLQLGGAALGRLPIPSWYRDTSLHRVLSSRHSAPSPVANSVLLDLLTGSAGIGPILTLADDRRIELLQLTFGPGEVIATCRTLPPAGSDSETAPNWREASPRAGAGPGPRQ